MLVIYKNLYVFEIGNLNSFLSAMLIISLLIIQLENVESILTIVYLTIMLIVH